MVAWNSSEEGFRLNTGEAENDFHLFCGNCQHTVSLSYRSALGIWPKGTSAKAMAQSLCCSRCGFRRAGLQLASQHASGRMNMYPEMTPETVTSQRRLGPTMVRRRRAFAGEFTGQFRSGM